MTHNPEKWLRHKRRLLDAWCAQGRPTYRRWAPDGYDVSIDMGGEYETELVVEAEEQHEESASEWDGYPGVRGGWHVFGVWLNRHGAWVDIMGRMGRDRLEAVRRELRAMGACGYYN